MTYKERIAAAVANPDANEKTIFNDAADGLLKTKDSSGIVETLATAEGIAATEPKVYVALLSQTGTNAPVATVLKNTLGGVPVWSYVSAGVYRASLAGAFAGSVIKLISLDPSGAYGAGDKPTAFINLESVNAVGIGTYVDGVPADEVLYTASLKIEVYP